MIEMRYSALNSRLLLPPSTTNDPGTLGPMDRMSKPRTLYSPPRNNRSKTGRKSVLPSGEMYSANARNPTEVRGRCLKKKIASPRGL
jgi:hypothetical protein